MRSALRSKARPIVAEKALWTVEDIIAATAGELCSRPRGPINNVSIDSRSITPGDVFIAEERNTGDGVHVQ